MTFLIPREAWSDFCDRGSFRPCVIKKFAQSVGITPFIVVGRLQKERRVAYGKLARLKHRYAWTS